MDHLAQLERYNRMNRLLGQILKLGMLAWLVMFTVKYAEPIEQIDRGERAWRQYAAEIRDECPRVNVTLAEERFYWDREPKSYGLVPASALYVPTPACQAALTPERLGRFGDTRNCSTELDNGLLRLRCPAVFGATDGGWGIPTRML